ncbi:MAG: amidohydrolase family protein [Pseudomonadota bacterium]
MTSRGVLDSVDIVVRDGRIASIVESGSIFPSRDVMVIDATGQFVIPGLSDMHVHVRHEDMLPALAAHGVTLIRDMWGSKETLNLRESVETKDRFAPQILAGSPGVDGEPPTFPGNPTITSSALAENTIRRLVEQGYDFVKIYDRLSADSFLAVAEACRANNIGFSGHPPFGVPFESVLVSGISSIEHLQGYMFATASEDLGFSATSIDPMRDFPRLMRATMTAEQSGRGVGSVFDSAKRAMIAQRTASNGVWNTPTLIAIEKTNTPSDERDAEFAREEMKYVSPQLKNQWRPANNVRFQFMTDDMLRGFRMMGRESQRMTKALQDAGAGLLVGTDTPEAFLIPGVSVHEELEQMVKAGLTPDAALAAATSNVGAFLGQPGSFGIVAEGAYANLVLLQNNPLEDIRHSRSIAGIVLRGKYFDRDALDSKLREISDRSQDTN